MTTPILCFDLDGRLLDCWEWQGAIQTKGYGSFSIGNGKTALAHRVAYEIITGKEIPKGMCVLHKCDNRKCVNPDHLFLGSILDNNRDMLQKGRNAKGERNGRSKLTLEDVKRMRELHLDGNYPIKQLEEIFSVSRSSIRKIIKEDYWKLPLAR